LATRGDRNALRGASARQHRQFLDLVAVEERRMEEEGLERRIRRRYAVWGDVPG